MLDPLKVAIDHDLVVAGLATYVVGTLVLIGYFLARTPLLKRAGIVLAVLACALQFIELGTRWNMTGVWPLTNLYGSLSLFSGLGVLIFLIFAWKYDLWLIGGGVLGISAIAFGYATTWNEGYMPAVPALQSYWIKVHVPLVVSSYASFMVAFVVSTLYLLKAYAERRFAAGGTVLRASAAGGAGTVTMTVAAPPPRPMDVTISRTETPNIAAAAESGDPLALWLAGLPSLARLDMLTYRIIAVGLPLLTVGIITGAMWANEAWGAYWQWDPKETAALLSWIVYAGFMHLHTRNAWRGERCAWVSIVGFASIMFCYLGVNIWISGLHSYKT
jgi:cytochrome c-type biogenesis protein CcsB